MAGVGDAGPSRSEAIRFAQRLLVLLDEGRFTATYKFAVLLALIDLCERSFLAASPHLERWVERFADGTLGRLGEIAIRSGWEHHPHRTLSVARSIYLQLPAHTKLWVGGREFAPAQPRRIRSLLSVPGKGGDPLR